MNFSWMMKMAWRDSRRQRGRLLLFMSSIVLGIAAMVAISSFGDQLQQQIDDEAKSLLGADIEVEARAPIGQEIIALFDSLGIATGREISFASMVRFNAEGATRLVNVRAVEANYPFYGDFETRPAGADDALAEERKALAAEALLLQFNISPGDTIGIGALDFELVGSVTKVPGQSGIAGSVAPPVFLPYSNAEATGLLQKGSRINYKLYGRYPEGFDRALYEQLIVPRMEEADLRVDDVEERRRETGAIFKDLTGFLNLTAFVALLLGCIGVASSAHLYVKEKIRQVAVLRCLGASGKESAGIYMLQLAGISLPASLLGALLGSALQLLLPPLVSDFLPVAVEAQFSAGAVITGVAIGVVTAMIFALPPLLRITGVSPLQVLRADLGVRKNRLRDVLMGVLILAYVSAFALLQIDGVLAAVFFVGGLVVALGLLTAMAKILTVAVRRFFPKGASFALRQGLANLYRPNNQTLVLLVTIGLGTGLIATLLLSQSLLLDKLQQSASGKDRPNMVLFDIQDDQIDSLQMLTRDFDFPVIGTVPIVNMRLHSLNGKSVTALKNDTTDQIRDRVLTREYRVTFRDSLTDAEEISAGQWIGTSNPEQGPVPVSIESRMAESMGVAVGDPLAFNVQGAVIECTVGSIRQVDWQRVQTNFLVVFPSGVLEEAPKFHVLLTRFGSTKSSVQYQGAVVKRFPNISIIDLNLVLQTIDEVAGKASFVIEFMALISTLTGIIVLIASIRTSKFQRMRESVLLRTLGASRKQIIRIAGIEYFMLGSLAALTGIGIALLASFALAQFSFDSLLSPQWGAVALIYVVIVVLTVVIGLLNTRSVVNQPPMEILKE